MRGSLRMLGFGGQGLHSGCWVLEGRDFAADAGFWRAGTSQRMLGFGGQGLRTEPCHTGTPNPASKQRQPARGKLRGPTTEASLLPAAAARSRTAARSPSEKRDSLLVESQPGPGFGEAERGGWAVGLTCCRAGRPGGASSITFPDSSAWMPAMPS